MKIFHTSDWHLGRTLYAKKRYVEFEAFLNWLIEQIQLKSPDLLIVAGDIFDTTTPSNKAQELYYQFLCKVAANTACRHMVIVGGNHDSPSLLNAPKQLLKQLKIHVVGNISPDYRDDVLELKDLNGITQALVCAIPYLRDRDIRILEEYELAEDKDKNFMQAIQDYYAKVCEHAEVLRQQLEHPVPIIATGHLFVTGGKTLKDDGVRELYVGSLAQFAANDFPPNIDYLALGHLHVPQIVASKDNYRYSGSPLAMGFGEARQQKIIIEADVNVGNVTITEIAIPKFQSLERVAGDLNTIKLALTNLVNRDESIWVEVDYTGQEIVTNLQQELQTVVINTQVELIKIHNSQLLAQVLSSAEYDAGIELANLNPEQVFDKCLTMNNIPAKQQEELKECFAQIMQDLATHDVRAE
ncbi:MAG: exonuclease SbcCD subunit D C-terminal domain-containing protein [Burkholderiales bacterium]|nr:exonuclease SbcCD subunit D C-terminal domain-containing protein [Burkholderiales bacterium]